MCDSKNEPEYLSVGLVTGAGLHDQGSILCNFTSAPSWRGD
jgi:hypothetical protein